MRNFPNNTDEDLLKIPPFRDSHIHFTVDGKPASTKDLLEIKDEYLRNGIFSVNDMGHVTGIGLKAKISPGRDILIRTAGFAIYKKGTYGAFLGRGIAEKNGIKRVIKDITDAGADFIKVVNSGVVCTKGDRTHNRRRIFAGRIEDYIRRSKRKKHGTRMSCEF